MRIIRRALCLLVLGALARPALADEIQLKDGKTFYGTIVGFDNKMFKVKTDFGFIYVEKDKIASIIPNKSESTQPAAASGSAGNNSSNPNSAPIANSSSAAKKQNSPSSSTQPE